MLHFSQKEHLYVFYLQMNFPFLLNSSGAVFLFIKLYTFTGTFYDFSLFSSVSFQSSYGGEFLFFIVLILLCRLLLASGEWEL